MASFQAALGAGVQTSTAMPRILTDQNGLMHVTNEAPFWKK